ncbi:MAG: hypothetical protein DRR19_30080 [Candidatus Parabeggiatoa sp. nov. 1]|nr:MAG: hypothetical protein DRR19_30080 [Gammaproteobacteria bacterium]
MYEKTAQEYKANLVRKNGFQEYKANLVRKNGVIAQEYKANLVRKNVIRFLLPRCNKHTKTKISSLVKNILRHSPKS